MLLSTLQSSGPSPENYPAPDASRVEAELEDARSRGHPALTVALSPAAPVTVPAISLMTARGRGTGALSRGAELGADVRPSGPQGHVASKPHRLQSNGKVDSLPGSRPRLPACDSLRQPAPAPCPRPRPASGCGS